MDIFKASTSDAECLVEDLWRPMALEMEKLSDFNDLADEDVRDDAVDYFTDRIIDSDHTVFILEVNGNPAGFLALEIKSAQAFFDRGLYGHIHELFVAEEFRRNGAASKLLEKAENFCKDYNCEMLQLSVNVKNEGAQKLYRDYNFEEERLKMVKEF